VPPNPAPRASIFIDRNSGGRIFRDILVAAGLEVILHDDVFNRDTPDHTWLKANADANRLIVSGDARTMRDLTFLRQLKNSQAHVFVLIALNGASREAKAGCILTALDLMLRIQKESAPPGLWKVHKNGTGATRCDHEKVLGRAHPKHR
jgi:hypothetical protein